MNKIYLPLLTALLLLTWSCKRELEDLNANPNAPEEVAPQFLLSNVLWEASNENSVQGWHAGNLLAQHTANIEFLPVDRYDLGTNTAYWNHLYHLLNDVKSMRTSENGNDAYDAVGMVLQAWIASQLTDLWGNVPYFEATQGAESGNWTPAFDAQENIYTAEGGILDLLRNASATLSNTSDVIAGDILYNGDLGSWERMANSLLVRYLLRVSDRVSVGTELQNLVDNAPLMQSNMDNAAVPYLTAAPNQWVIFTERVGRYTDVVMSETADQILNGLGDARLPVLFKTTNVNPTEYKGLPNGLSRDSQTAYDLSDISLVGAFFRDIPDGPDANFMHYAELQFALAEASQKGLISGVTSAYYDEGIRASHEYYGLTLDPTYLLNTGVMLDGSADLERIMTQKWIALFLHGHEAWFNVRRTGFPVLPIPADNLNNNQFPVRYRYPESEQAVNGTNYSAAVSAIGADDLNQQGWWEQ